MAIFDWLNLGRRGDRKALRVQDLWREVFGGLESSTGLSISWDTALHVTAVLRCSLVIADVVGSVPVKLYRKERNTGAREEATDLPVADVVAAAPNAWQDSLEWRATMGLHRGLTGGAYNVIARSGDRIVELLPIEPGVVTVDRGRDLRPRYKVRNDAGGVVDYGPDEVWHWRGPSWNGWQGMDRVKLAREAIGLAMALERSHGRMHKHGVQTTGLYSIAGNLDDKQHDRLTKWIADQLAGLDNVGKPLVMDRDTKFTPTAMKGTDAQHLETRRYQVEEVCRGMGVMPIMAGYIETTNSYASVEQMLLAHAIHTARPLWRSFEASAARNLLTVEQRRAGYYFKFSDGELLRGDAKTRAEYYSKALGAGGAPPWLTQNEVRGFEELPPRPETWADELPRGTNPAGTAAAKPTTDPEQPK